MKQRHRVLVVDDEPGIQLALRELLDFEGYEVRAASDGQEALRLLADWQPEAILLDLMMPAMDGQAFRSALRERGGRLAGIPVIVLSAAPDTASRAKAMGASAHIIKPFDLDDILDALTTVQQPANGQPTRAHR